MSDKHFIITPKHTFELNTQVIHAYGEQEAGRLAQDKYLETGKVWEIFESRGTVAFDSALVHRLVEENIRLKTEGRTASSAGQL